MRRPDKAVTSRLTKWMENQVFRTLQKYGEIPMGISGSGYPQEPAPPYERQFNPRWIYRLRRNSALINNAIEEKVNQTLRRGWSEWEEEYEAKCPSCKKEFGSDTPFRQLVGNAIPEDTDIDFSKRRECPNCGEMVQFEEPEYADLKRAKDFWEHANEKDEEGSHLVPDGTSSVSQSLLEVLREIAWDIESFDNGWMLIERSYKLDDEGRILDWKPEEVHRAPPEKMRYVINESTGKFGGNYWVCVSCRAEKGADYEPERQNQTCTRCGNETYEAYAISTEGIMGDSPQQFYLRGEFIHRSLYEPSKYYGYPPIISLWEESRTLEQMDSWYKEAYEQRRAPRGAIAIKGSNQQSTIDWNKKQFEKMKSDPNHIPTLMDDSDGDGDPIKFITLLESPAEMQHMEMRNWFKERISAKWGVTPIFMGSPSESGLSQSMEIEVSNRAADRLRTVINEGFVNALLAQLGIEGWTVGVAPVEEEDEQSEIELRLKHLQAAQQAATMGLEVEWTEDDRAHIKPGEAELEEGEEGQGMGGLDGLGELGSDMEETAADQGGPEEQQDVQTATEAAGGDRVDLGSPGSGGGQE